MFSLKIITTVMMSLHNNGILTKTNNHLFTRNLSPSFTGIKAVLALFSLLHTPSSSLIIFHQSLCFLSVGPGDRAQVISSNVDASSSALMLFHTAFKKIVLHDPPYHTDPFVP